MTKKKMVHHITLFPGNVWWMRTDDGSNDEYTESFLAWDEESAIKIAYGIMFNESWCKDDIHIIVKFKDKVILDMEF